MENIKNAGKRTGIVKVEHRHEKRQSSEISAKSQLENISNKGKFVRQISNLNADVSSLNKTTLSASPTAIKGHIRKNVALSYSPLSGKYTIKNVHTAGNLPAATVGRGENIPQKSAENAQNTPSSMANIPNDVSKIPIQNDTKSGNAPKKNVGSDRSKKLATDAIIEKTLAENSDENLLQSATENVDTTSETYHAESVTFSFGSPGKSTITAYAADTVDKIQSSARMSVIDENAVKPEFSGANHFVANGRTINNFSETKINNCKESFYRYNLFNNYSKENQKDFAYRGSEARKREREQVVQAGKEVAAFGKKISHGVKTLEGTVASDGSVDDFAAVGTASATFAYKSYAGVRGLSANMTTAAKDRVTKQFRIASKADKRYQSTFRKLETTRFKIENGGNSGKLSGRYERLSSKAKKEIAAINWHISKAQKSLKFLKKQQDTYAKSRYVRARAKVSTATGAISKVGGVAVSILNALKMSGRALVPENSSMLAVLFGGVFMIIMLVIIVMIIAAIAILYPMQAVGQWVDGIFHSTPVQYPGQAAAYYMEIEQSVGDEQNAAIAKLESKPSSGGGIDLPSLDAYNDAKSAYDESMSEFESTGTYTDADGNTVIGHPDSTSVTTAKSAYDSDLESYGVVVGDDGSITVKDGGSLPPMSPVYEGTRWLGSWKSPPSEYMNVPPDNGQTDAESVELSDEFKMQMLSTLCADRGVRIENKTLADDDELDTDEVKSFFNALPLWTFDSYDQIVYHKVGCMSYEQEVTTAITTTDPVTGVSTTTTETTTKTVRYCPGHIFTVMNLQLDTDPLKTKTDEIYSIDREWDKIWSTSGKSRKRGENYYKDIFKQMGKDVKAHGDIPTLPDYATEDSTSS
jgi:hypothetical protein